jgi:hypothetical protein
MSFPGSCKVNCVKSTDCFLGTGYCWFRQVLGFRDLAVISLPLRSGHGLKNPRPARTLKSSISWDEKYALSLPAKWIAAVTASSGMATTMLAAMLHQAFISIGFHQTVQAKSAE